MSRVPGAVWVMAAIKIGFHLATTRLSFHRDELYFISASKRLAVSFVDFQPVTPVLVRVVRMVFGESIWGIRLIPAVAGALVIVLAAILARELGGDRRAQTFAAFVALVIPLFVGANSALNTLTLEIPAWLLVAIAIAHVERTGDPKTWLWAGAAIGLAVLVKFTVLGYLVGVVIAVAATSLRKHLRSPWLWAGAGVAVVMVTPSFVWQFTNGLPVVEFVSNQSGGGKVLGLSGRVGFLASLVIFPGPIGLFVMMPGFRWLLADPHRRATAIAAIAPLVVFLFASGKGYYASPAMAVALVAGAVAITSRRARVSRLLLAGLIVNLAIPLPLLVPIVPISVLRENEDIAAGTEMGERLGWDDLALEVAEVMERLSVDERNRAVVIGSNYAIPAAIEYYTDELGLPPAVSGHNSSYLWWPRIPDDHVAITVGFERREIAALYEDVQQVELISNRHGVKNYEWGDPVIVARDPKVSPEQLRERVRIFTA